MVRCAVGEHARSMNFSPGLGPVKALCASVLLRPTIPSRAWRGFAARVVTR